MLTNTDVNLKRMHQLFCYMTLFFFSSFVSDVFIFMNLLKPDVPGALKMIIVFRVSETLMRRTKELYF